MRRDTTPPAGGFSSYSRYPAWNTISVSGYHIREAGSTAAQELAFTLANGVQYVRAAIDAGLSMFTHLGNGCPMQMHRHDNIIQRNEIDFKKGIYGFYNLDPNDPTGKTLYVGNVPVTAEVLSDGKFGLKDVDLATTLPPRKVMNLLDKAGIKLIGPGDITQDTKLQAMGDAAVGQSGALGLALLEQASARGLGLSAFISVGNKVDVSGKDTPLAEMGLPSEAEYIAAYCRRTDRSGIPDWEWSDEMRDYFAREEEAVGIVSGGWMGGVTPALRWRRQAAGLVPTMSRKWTKTSLPALSINP